MVDWLTILVEASQKMRQAVLPLFATKEIKTKLGIGAGGDEIKKIDMAAENALIQTLQKHKVSCTLISEESGTKEIGNKPQKYYVTVDPLDGTTNALRGIPFMATSIAVSQKPNIQFIETALVTDLYHDITYTAQKTKGAFRNQKKISPSKTTTLEEAVVGLDLNTYKKTELVSLLSPILKETKHLRHLGANALELCYVADATTDAFIDLRGKLRVTDVAAAHLILQEAGAIITAPDGKELDAPLDASQRVSFIAVGNCQLYQTIMACLALSKTKGET